jgi:UDP-glucose 4-epimerase
MNIAITGIAGYFGHIILRRLSEERNVKIVGIDIVEPKSLMNKGEFFKVDVRDPQIVVILGENTIDVMVHLVFIMPPAHNRREAYDINVNGTRNVLDACYKANVKKIIIASSTAVYGAHVDNPDWLTEDSPLRGNPEYYYSADKMEVEQLCSQFAKAHSAITMTILRPCDVYGPDAHYALARVFDRKRVYLFEGFDPQYQFLHEDDLAEAFLLAIQKDTGGVFNVTPDGTLSLSEAAMLAGKEVGWVRLTRMMDIAMRVMALLHLLDLETSPAARDIWKYRWTASNERIKREFGFHPQYTSREAFASKYIHTVHSYTGKAG